MTYSCGALRYRGMMWLGLFQRVAKHVREVVVPGSLPDWHGLQQLAAHEAVQFERAAQEM